MLANNEGVAIDDAALNALCHRLRERGLPHAGHVLHEHVPTPEHADEALRGLREAGCRAVFAYGYQAVLSPDYSFADNEARLADARRLRSWELADDGALVTMGVALAELGLEVKRRSPLGHLDHWRCNPLGSKPGRQRIERRSDLVKLANASRIDR